MFRPNKVCYISVASGRTDVYGQPLSATKVREQCAVVRLVTTNMKSAVRADSSASRGNAKELVGDSLILLTATTAASIDDLIDVGGDTFRILSMHPRYSVGGALDHYEVTASVWS